MVTFVFPLVYAVFFGVIFANVSGGTTTLNVVVVDEDGGRESTALVERLIAAPEFSVTVSDRRTAFEGLRQSRHLACIILPEGFKATAAGFEPAPPLTLAIDPIRRLEAGALEGLLLKYAIRRGNPAVSPGEDRFEADRGLPAVRVETIDWATRSGTDAAPSTPYAVAFPQGIVWGVLGCTATFGVSLVMERRRGTLFRLRAAPIDRASILGGKAIACFSMTVMLGVALFAVAFLLFGVEPYSFGALGAALLSIAVGFVGVMMLLSVFGRTEQAASGISWTILLAMAMSGGAMVPYFFMPAWLQRIADFSPVRWAILAMDGAIWRRFTPAEMLVPCGSLVAVGIVCFVVGAVSFRWTD